MAKGYYLRLSDIATLFAWHAHQTIGSRADEKWRSKFGSFRDFVEFFKPPFLITETDEK